MVDTGTNVLTVGIENGASRTVDLSHLDDSGTDDQSVDDLFLFGGELNISLEGDGVDPSRVDLISNNANNDISAGTDGGLYLNVASVSISETVTTLTDNLDGTYTYASENGTPTRFVGTDDQGIEGLVVDTGTNVLTVGIENGASRTVDLSHLDDSGTDDQTAGEVEVADAANHFTATDVEGVLEELKSEVESSRSPWNREGTTTVANSNTNDIYIQADWLGIGMQDRSNTIDDVVATGERLWVDGTIRTSGSVYPDYVFEEFVEGVSKIVPDYRRRSLKDVLTYIKTYKHLPGVTGINELPRTANGYSFNITDLAVQSLEKIEELYLYLIEQQQKVERQQEQIDTLKARLFALEKKFEKEK
ncbi:hypothetical protein [Flagellimonas onchidii]|uniref:hypothetical protein n=1 Tax=Flagellimonas onchidii TaxID=2562684 RepID=UPI0010A5EA56|nr:hypothetical protein [Allomuricauda onchidii]